MIAFLISATVTFVLCWVLVPAIVAFLKAIQFITTVQEGSCKVYMLYGKVLGVITEPGLNFLWFSIGFQAVLVPIFGAVYEVDLRLDQEYLRSNPVNSEEGAPMGVGVWYEMRVSNPVDWIFKNADPKGSLRANIFNATVRCLSNMPLNQMLEDRHSMSQIVRKEVSPTAEEWGYKLGSVYIRNVHFKDPAMIRQIEQKVVNRLRQVTSAIRQAGANQVNLITSSAERQAAIEFAKARSLRPQMMASVLEEVGQDSEILDAVYLTLEVERLVGNTDSEITLVPSESTNLLSSLVAVEPVQRKN
jgi:regulator of protease activity HflC (stomatin/prohibitin superfamily)